jgi:hypothetical protein
MDDVKPTTALERAKLFAKCRAGFDFDDELAAEIIETREQIEELGQWLKELEDIAAARGERILRKEIEYELPNQNDGDETNE